jgi:hypothetical protein
MDQKSIEWNKRFYRYPTGPGSQGGYDYLCGLPCKPSQWVIDNDYVEAYTFGYEYAKKLWPTEKDKEWFNP